MEMQPRRLILVTGLLFSVCFVSQGQEPIFAFKVDSAQSSSFYRVTFSPDGKYLAALGDHMSKKYECGVLLFDVKKRELVAQFLSPRSLNGYILGFSPDSKRLITSSSKHDIEIWDLTTKKIIKTATAPAGAIRSGIVAHDGKTIAFGGKPIRIFDLRSGKTIAELFDYVGTPPVEPPKMNYYPTCLAYSPDGKSFVAGFSGGMVACWDLTTKKCRWTVQQYEEGDRVASVVFSPDSNRIAVSPGFGSKKRLAILRWKDGSEENAIHYGNLGIAISNPKLVFSPDGASVLLAGNRRGTFVYKWDIKGGKLFGVKEPTVRKPVHCDCLALSPDGKILVTASQGILFWDTNKIDVQQKAD